MASIKITSKEAEEAVKRLIKVFKDLREATIKAGKSGLKSSKQVADEVKRQEAAYRKVVPTVKKLDTALKNMTKSQRSFVTQTRNLKKELVKSNAQLDRMAKKTKKVRGGFIGLLRATKGLLAAFGLIAGFQIFVSIIKNVFELTKTFDSLGFALERIAGSMIDVAESERFLKEITINFGIELVSTTNRWIKFLAAAKQSGLTLKDTEDIFRSMAKVAGVLGLATHELTGIYLALEQMLSKGKVTTEELRRQLGERLPGAMGIMAASIGVSISALDKMLKKGEILSAEVLPNFARAVEFAFGIENVNKIDTLVSAQNRLTTAWQFFVKTVIKDSTLLKKAFNFLGGMLNTLSTVFSGDIDREGRAFSKRTKELEKELKDRFLKIAENNLKEKGLAARLIADKITLEKQLASARASIDKDFEKQVNKKLEENREQATLLGKETARLIKIEALAQIQAAEDVFLKQSEFVKQLTEIKINSEKKGRAGVGNIATGEAIQTDDKDQKSILESIDNLSDLNEVLSKQSTILGEVKADFVLYKKTLEESTVSKFEPDDGADSKSIFKQLALREKEMQIAILKHRIAGNDNLIKADLKSAKEQIKLTNDTADSRILIIGLENDIIKRDAEIRRKILINSAQKRFDNEKLIADEGLTLKETLTKRLSDIDKQFDNIIIKSGEDRDAKLIQSAEKHFNDIISIKKNETDLKILLAEEPFRVIEKNLKEELSLDTLTKSERKSLNKQLKENTIAMEKAKQRVIIETILLEIKQLELLGELGVETKAKIKELLALIAKIEGSGGIPGFDDSDIEKVRAFWNEVLGLASDFNNAIGDLSNAIFDRKIENINAEIEAETEKFDKLIELEEGNDLQQRLLRIAKEASIKKLEKKRLIEEQKQAKARKAFAIADIAISTASGIIAAFAPPPIGAGPLTGGILAALVATLGAIQIAAVLAAPIPQFGKGGDVKEDTIALINEAGSQEYIERDGKILTTASKNAIVPLEAGDTVYKDYDELTKKSILLTGLYGGIEISQSNFNDLFGGIRNSIKDGFKNAKINNSINLIGFDPEQNAYREKMSNWN